MHYAASYYSTLVKNKNNINIVNSSNKFKITFLIAIFVMILVTATLSMGIKAAVVFAQGNNSTNSTSSLHSDNQTSGLDYNVTSLKDIEEHNNDGLFDSGTAYLTDDSRAHHKS
jgi:hypothetical protein